MKMFRLFCCEAFSKEVAVRLSTKKPSVAERQAYLEHPPTEDYLNPTFILLLG